MRIYISSGESSAINAALSTGYVCGVTLNPTFLRRAGVSARQVPALIQQAVNCGAKEVHVQVYADKPTEMISEARELAAVNPEQVVVRMPATSAGYAAAAQLYKQSIRTSLTAVYTLRQVLLAESVGADFIVAYLGRMRDAGLDGMSQIGKMQELLQVQHSDLTLIVGSIREAIQVEQLALLGVKAVTLPSAVLEKLLESPMTDQAAQTFREDARVVREQDMEVGAH